jgi:hypothetical protein
MLGKEGEDGGGEMCSLLLPRGSGKGRGNASVTVAVTVSSLPKVRLIAYFSLFLRKY